MQETGIGVLSIKKLTFLIIIITTVVGTLVHRDFLFLWGVGLMFGFFLISKSFCQKSFLSVKKNIECSFNHCNWIRITIRFIKDSFNACFDSIVKDSTNHG